MKTRSAAVLAALAALWVGAGCASKAVILTPGAVPLPAEREEGTRAWSLWVEGARDARPPEKAGQKVGTLYSRFEKTPQTAYLDPSPEVYVRQELSRFLLHKGLEASSKASAKLLLEPVIEEFELSEDPGSVWDKIAVRVAYTVRLSDPSGRDRGRVRLEASKEVSTPVGSRKQAETAFREAVAETFRGLLRSEVYQKVLAESAP